MQLTIIITEYYFEQTNNYDILAVDTPHSKYRFQLAVLIALLIMYNLQQKTYF